MDMIETNRLKENIESPPVYHCLVNDAFCVIDSNPSMGKVLHQFNAAHSYVQFTVEAEMNSQIPLLNVLLTRKKSG